MLAELSCLTDGKLLQLGKERGGWLARTVCARGKLEGSGLKA